MPTPSDYPATTPYWWDAAEPATMAVKDVAPESDVVVVGAGFTGLSAALTLSRAGRSVQVFDRDDPGRGASSRNGGMASGNLAFGLEEMIRRFGIERARGYYAEGREAREDLARFIANESIDCDFQMTGRFTGAMTPAHFANLEREAIALNEHVGIDARIVSRSNMPDEIGSDLYHGGLVRPDIGGLHPGKLHAGMMASAKAAGIGIHGKTAVKNIQRDGNAYKVTTDRGSVTAPEVIVATNGYTDAGLPWLRRRIVPVASQIIATEELSQSEINRMFPKRRMHGETKRLFLYYRPSPDGRRVLCGGRALAPLDRPRELADNMHARLTEIFPALVNVQVSHCWWGYVGITFDHLPHLTRHDGIHYATGFNGSGVVWARWLGQKAAWQILGDERAASSFETDAFPTRPLYSGNPWFLPAAITWADLRDRIDRLGS